MPFQPGGRKDRPFGDALRMEIAAAGDDRKELRAVARNLLTLAKQPDAVGLAAIRELGDRLDGKARQESEVTVRAAAARELTDDDLAAIAVGADDQEVQEDPKQDPSKLN